MIYLYLCSFVHVLLLLSSYFSNEVAIWIQRVAADVGSCYRSEDVNPSLLILDFDKFTRQNIFLREKDS